MKRKSYVLFSLFLTALISGLTIWNFSATSISAQKSDNPGTVGVVTEYNARNEFALTQGGTNGVWRYGYTANDASNVFVQHSTNRTTPECGSPAERWNLSNSGDPTPEIIRFLSPTTCIGTPNDSLYVHPGGGGQRSVLRFVAPAAGTYQLTGALQRANLSATTDLRIVQNETTSLLTGDINSKYQLPFNLTVTVAAGDTIDFSVGFGNGSYNNDGSSLNVTVAQSVTACLTPPANLQVNVPAENSPVDVQSINTNASLVGDAAYTNMGKVGRAFDFDGNGDYVRVEDNAAQRPATAVTAEGWFKFDSASGLVSLISKPIRNSSLNSYTLYLDGGQLRGLVSNGPQYTRVFSNFTPQTGVWHHLAFTYDFTGGVSTLKLYANGVEVTSGQDGTANILPFYDANPYPLLIGGEFETDAPTFFLDGQADEVAVYGRALSQSEIFDIVQQGSFGKCPPTACVQPPNNLVSWFAGEQNALDSKSNNHGTLQNGATFANGKVGKSFDFPNGNAHVSIPDSSSLRPTNFTIEGWFNFSSYANEYRQLVGKQSPDPSYNSYAIFIYGGLLTATATDGINLGNTLNYSLNPTPGQWYHIAFTRQNGGTQTLYINGAAVDTNAASSSIAYTNTPLLVGDNLGSSILGEVDELSIYDRTLSASEIQSIYNAASSGKCKPTGLNPPANQVAWFTGDGDTRDFTGLNANGTLQGDTNYKVGKVGQAFNLDGNGDYMTTADSPNWDFGTGDFAVEAWFNSPNPTGVQRIISAGSQADGANNLWTLGYGDICAWGCGQRLNFAVFNGGGYNDYSSNQVVFRPNTWHHAAVVRSGSTLAFYLDGVPVGTVTIGAGFAVNGGSTGAIIGARYNSNPADRFEFANAKLDEISVYKRTLSASEIAAVYNAGTAGKLKSASTPVNFARSVKTEASFAPTTVQLSSASVTFQQVTQAGTTSQSGIDLGVLPPLPQGYVFTGLAYDISTNAIFSGSAAVCFNIPSVNTSFANLRILHLENGVWANRTAPGASSPVICTEGLTSLSPFVIVDGLAPTAAFVSVGGRVTNAFGSGLRGVYVSLTNTQGETRNVMTNDFGYFAFNEVAVGEIYTISVASKRYSFAVSSQAVNVQDSISDLNFVANGER